MTETSPLASISRLPGDAEDDRGRGLRDPRVPGPHPAAGRLPHRRGGGRRAAGARAVHRAPATTTTTTAREKFTEDGWLRTGDVAELRHGSYLHLVDRTKDLVKSGGEWISSVELENEIMAHADVLEAAVIAIPDEKWSERPCACVVLKPGAELDPEACASSSPAAWPSGGCPTASSSSTRCPRPRWASSTRRSCARGSPASSGSTRARRVKQLVVSDLHLGARTNIDLLRRAELREPLLAALEDVDRLVLLGDVLEMRDGPAHEALAAARALFEALGRSARHRPRGRHRPRQPRPRAHRAVARGAPAGARRPAARARAGREPAEASPLARDPGEWLAPSAGARSPTRACGCATTSTRPARPLPRRPHHGALLRAHRRRASSSAGCAAAPTRAPPAEDYEGSSRRSTRCSTRRPDRAREGPRPVCGASGRACGACSSATAGAARSAHIALGTLGFPAAICRAQPRRARAAAVRAVGRRAAPRRPGRRWARSSAASTSPAAHVIFGHTHRTRPVAGRRPRRVAGARRRPHAQHRLVGLRAGCS